MRRPKSGFTLAEMMLTLALVSLVYTMISTILIQISRYVRSGRQVAQQRQELLSTVEELRYQMRSLYFPAEGVGLIGQRSPLDGRDSLRFTTSNGRTHKGIVEVGYQINDYVDPGDETKNAPALYYREFPFRRREMRTLDIHQEAIWKPYLKKVEVFQVEYSAGGTQFQRSWEQASPPSRIRVRLERFGENGDKITFDVTPGVGAARW